VIWCVLPAAGSGSRMGAARPKQYLELLGQPLIAHTLDALCRHRAVSGLVVALAADDAFWPGWSEWQGRPLLRAEGGATRADSVLAGLKALPVDVSDQHWVLVHDAARPLLREVDLDRLLRLGCSHVVGALLAAPLRDTLKRASAAGEVEATEPREMRWRAFTPQLFRRGELRDALLSARAAGVSVTDESSAFERIGRHPLLVEGDEDNLKVTTGADLRLAEYLLRQQQAS
jgi:2-C-methyl-D-erythritol 4-phosphate cytidylyltransferase